jgi:hypothetical protein
MKKLGGIIAVLTVGAVGGFFGVAAGAQAEHRTTTSDKPRYASQNFQYTGGRSLAAVSSTPTKLLKIAVTSPSAGTASIALTTQFWTDYPDNSANTHPLYASWTMGRCDAANTLASSHCKDVEIYYTQKLPGATSSDITEPFALNATLHFSGHATKALYINATAAGYPTGFYSGGHVQVEFTPAHPIALSSQVAVHAT